MSTLSAYNNRVMKNKSFILFNLHLSIKNHLCLSGWHSGNRNICDCLAGTVETNICVCLAQWIHKHLCLSGWHRGNRNICVWLAQWIQKHLCLSGWHSGNRNMCVCLAGTVDTETVVSVWLAQWKQKQLCLSGCLSLLCPGFDNWRPHLR